MNDTTRQSRFLEAINKYAEQQKESLQKEVEEYKNEKVEQATEAGLRDAYQLIQKEINKQKSEIISKTAANEKKARLELFDIREKMVDSIFAEAGEKLVAFTKTDAYPEKLLKSAEEIDALFGGASCVVSLAPQDMDYADKIAAVIRNSTVREDPSIRIGGIKAYAKELGLLADDTYDAKLVDKRQWFVENSSLQVV